MEKATKAKGSSVIFLFIMVLFELEMSSCDSNVDRKKFYQLTTSDFSRYSFYVGINLKSGKKVSPALIENDDLYYVFSKEKNIPKDEYSNLIVSKLLFDSSIEVLETDTSRFKYVFPIESVIADSKIGREFFIRKYFEKKVLRSQLSEHVKTAVIYQLFKWGIACKQDDETGLVVIYQN